MTPSLSQISKRLCAIRVSLSFAYFRKLYRHPDIRRRRHLASSLVLIFCILLFLTPRWRWKRLEREKDISFELELESAGAKWKIEKGTVGGGGTWETIMNDVVVGVKTGHEVANTRLTKLRRSGWYSTGRAVPNMIVMSDWHDYQLGVVGVKAYAHGIVGNQTMTLPTQWFEKSGWRGDKDKNLPALHLMRRIYPGKKWYLLLDDDTYIFLDNFARYVLRDHLDDTPIYTGKVFFISRCGGFLRDGSWAANRSEPKGMFAHGGSGIVVNGNAMEKVYPKIPHCIREFGGCWAGDMQVGLCLRQSGVMLRRHGGKAGYERHFIPFCPSKSLSDRRYISRWKGREEPITFHKIPEREQKLMSEFETKVAANGDVVRYTDLRRHLLGNGILPCHTAHNKKVKWYTEVFMPPGFKG